MKCKEKLLAQNLKECKEELNLAQNLKECKEELNLTPSCLGGNRWQKIQVAHSRKLFSSQWLLVSPLLKLVCPQTSVQRSYHYMNRLG